MTKRSKQDTPQGVSFAFLKCSGERCLKFAASTSNGMHLFRSLSLVLILVISPLVASAQFTGWDAAEQSRTHATDISHIEMRIAFDQPAHKLMGTVLHTLSILPQKGPVDSVMFDAVNMTIEKVWIE